MEKFRLKAGTHTSGLGKTGTRKIYIPGEEIESESEKQTEFMRKYPDKYEELTSRSFSKGPITKGSVPRTSVEKTKIASAKDTEVVEIDPKMFDKMDTRQLLQFARDNKIEIKGATNREEILSHIKVALTEE